MVLRSLEQVLGQWEAQHADQSYHRFQRILQHWPTLVGEGVAAHTKPYLLQDRILKVATTSSAWAQTLTFERPRILAKLNQTMPELCLVDIRFTPGRWQPMSLEGHLLETPRPLAPNSKTLKPERTTYSLGPDQLPVQLDPKAAFQQWATLVQQQQRSRPLCPQCRCPSPPEELQRWSVCALCIIKKW